VEYNRKASAHLIQQYQRLKAENVSVQCTDILDYLRNTQQKYDLIFIDPPYAQPELRESILNLLQQNDLMNDGCLLYLEWPRTQQIQLNNENLIWIKQKNAGQVEYAIAQWQLSR
jgi:16S rRNA (guanine966-N2)-methyltransferase